MLHADEYIIMSNDTGYDPAVRFWKDKGFAVRRFNVNFCKQAVQRRKNIKYQVVADIPSKEDNANNNINTDTDTDAITAKSYNLNELIDGNHSSYTDSEPLGDELATNDDLPSSDKLMTTYHSLTNRHLLTVLVTAQIKTKQMRLNSQRTALIYQIFLKSRQYPKTSTILR